MRKFRVVNYNENDKGILVLPWKMVTDIGKVYIEVDTSGESEQLREAMKRTDSVMLKCNFGTFQIIPLQNLEEV